MAAAAEDDVSMAAAAAASAAMDAGDGDDEAMTLEVVPAPVASEAQMARAVELKDRGNAFFKGAAARLGRRSTATAADLLGVLALQRSGMHQQLTCTTRAWEST